MIWPSGCRPQVHCGAAPSSMMLTFRVRGRLRTSSTAEQSAVGEAAASFRTASRLDDIPRRRCAVAPGIEGVRAGYGRSAVKQTIPGCLCTGGQSLSRIASGEFQFVVDWCCSGERGLEPVTCGMRVRLEGAALLTSLHLGRLFHYEGGRIYQFVRYWSAATESSQ